MFTIEGLPSEYQAIPISTLRGIARYVNDGTMPGDFLVAALENKFVEAVCCADEGNLHAIHTIALLIYNRIPGSCWGSHEIVRMWSLEKEKERYPDEG